MRVLVTGGSGFIGTNMVSFYIEKGIEVCNIDIAPPKNVLHKHLWRECDIRDFPKLKKEIHGFSPTHIMHLAARTGEGKDITDFDTNIQGVENLIHVCKDLPNLQRIIFTSSQLVCKADYKPKNDQDYCPPNLYGLSKMKGEQIVRREFRENDSPWTIVRPIGIWGPWFELSYKKLFLMIASGLYFHTGNRGAIMHLGYVGNTVYQYHNIATALSEKVNGKMFYLGDSSPINLRDWANLIQKTFGARKIPTLPLWLLEAFARTGDGLKILGWKDPPLTSSRLQNMLVDFKYDLDPLVSEGLPYTLEEGVKITVDYLKQH